MHTPPVLDPLDVDARRPRREAYRGAALVIAVRWLCLLGLLTAGQASAQDLRSIPGSRVAIAAPATFAASDRFAGFIDAATNASIVVLDVPAAGYEQMAANLTPEVLSAGGVSNALRSTLPGRAAPHVYFTGEQGSAIGPVLKQILLVREGEHAALITVNVPQSAVGKGVPARAALEAMLAGVVIRAEPAAARQGFRFGYLGPLRDAGTIGGTSRLYTLDGERTPSAPQPGRTLFLIVPSASPAPVADIAALADRALTEIAGTTEVKTTARTPVTIAGLSGIEHVATGRTAAGTIAIGLYQVVLANPAGGYIRMVGQAAEPDAAKLIAEFQAIARSLVLQ
jgi:hypothetical protein